MSKGLKVLSIIAALIVLFVASKYINLSPSSDSAMCPPDKCGVTETGPNGEPIELAFAQEEGRVREYFGTVPPGMPAGMPVDTKPLKVIDSYTESVEKDDEAGRTPHSRAVYAYTTSEDSASISKKFKDYLTAGGYSEVTLNQDKTNQSTYTLYGHKKVEGGAGEVLQQFINISITSQSQVENLISITVILAQ